MCDTPSISLPHFVERFFFSTICVDGVGFSSFFSFFSCDNSSIEWSPNELVTLCEWGRGLGKINCPSSGSRGTDNFTKVGVPKGLIFLVFHYFEIHANCAFAFLLCHCAVCCPFVDVSGWGAGPGCSLSLCRRRRCDLDLPFGKTPGHDH